MLKKLTHYTLPIIYTMKALKHIREELGHMIYH